METTLSLSRDADLFVIVFSCCLVYFIWAQWCAGSVNYSGDRQNRFLFLTVDQDDGPIQVPLVGERSLIFHYFSCISLMKGDFFYRVHNQQSSKKTINWVDRRR